MAAFRKTASASVVTSNRILSRSRTRRGETASRGVRHLLYGAKGRRMHAKKITVSGTAANTVAQQTEQRNGENDRKDRRCGVGAGQRGQCGMGLWLWTGVYVLKKL